MSDRRIRNLEKRRARGRHRALKMGKKAIRFLSEEEAFRLIQETKKRIVGTGNATNVAKRGAKKHLKKIKRIISLARKNKNYARVKNIEKVESDLLKSLCPERDQTWVKFSKRRNVEKIIKLENFSFIDMPAQTIESLGEIAKAETVTLNTNIHFSDMHCLDIAPYMVLALMRKDMAPIITGGKVKPLLYDVFKAVDLLGPLKINPLNVPSYDQVLPFQIKSRRPQGTSSNVGLITSETTEEKVAEQFSDTFNDWLRQLNPPLELTDRAYVDVNTIFGELLDNATRHSDLKSFDGAWHIAGFMERVQAGVPENPTDADMYICHFAVISLGNTIYESLQIAPEEIKSSITRYCLKVNQQLPKRQEPFTDENLWTVCSIQDGISRAPNADGAKGGFGLMSSLVSLMNAFGIQEVLENAPKMTIVSGSSCIMIKLPYNRYTEIDGKRSLAFNADNNLDKPPDANHVLSLPRRFPGTLITVRFVMDGGHLIATANGKEQ